MKTTSNNSARWITVAVFALAMAWVESAVVFYLRTMIDRIDPYQPNPLPVIGNFGTVELVREAATMVMLLALGFLAGHTWYQRSGYAALAFGIWDISYYVFLKIMCGWPHSLLDWDILFLIPLPWWGPVLAPLCISLLMILWGTLASQFTGPIFNQCPGWKTSTISFAGVLLALYVFMTDALHAANGGMAAVVNVLPAHFQWPLFCLALAFMAAPVIHTARQIMLLRTGTQPATALEP